MTENRQHRSSLGVRKPLVLVMLGGSGVGKTLTASVIARRLFRGGFWSEYCHLITADFFAGHQHSMWQAYLISWIEAKVTACPYSLFVFDDILDDPFYSQVIASVRPFLAFFTDIAGVSYRHSIFLFISSFASEQILLLTSNHYQSGRPRDQILLDTVVNAVINDQLDNVPDWLVLFLNFKLVDHVIPFLPITTVELTECIRDDFRSRFHQDHQNHQQIDDTFITKVVSKVTFMRNFSVVGCKGVSDKVSATIS